MRFTLHEVQISHPPGADLRPGAARARSFTKEPPDKILAKNASSEWDEIIKAVCVMHEIKKTDSSRGRPRRAAECHGPRLMLVKLGQLN